MSVQKALVIHCEKTPYTLVDDWPVPEPGPTDVLIKVLTIGLNPVDAFIEVFGVSFFRLTPPVVFGVDGAGVVVRVGSEVTSISKGDRV